MKNIAICVITYNRLHSLKRLLASLNAAYYEHSVELIISIDKSDTTICADYAKEYRWEYGDKHIIEHPQNLGLRNHVLFCGDLLNEDKYDALVVLEDDISVAPSFFYYTEQCVEKYWDSQEVAGISLYRFPLNYQCRLPFVALQSDSDVYLQQTAMSWGQVWMKRQWQEFRQWYQNNSEEFGVLPHLPKSICLWPKSSWLKYHSRYCIEQNKYFVYPYVSLATNNGDAGTHNKKSDTTYQAPMLYEKKIRYNLNPIIKYDGFFENEILYEVLGLDKSQLCVDFYGEKGNRERRKYWLTTKRLSYKIIKSYALSLKPYEMNVILDRTGNDCYLYDTSIFENRKTSEDITGKKYYLYTVEITIKSIIKNKVLEIISKYKQYRLK